MSTDSPSNKPPRILSSSRAPARCGHTGTKFNMLYHLYIKVSQHEIRRINIFQKQNHYNKVFFTSKICKSAAMGRSRRLVILKKCSSKSGENILSKPYFSAESFSKSFLKYFNGLYEHFQCVSKVESNLGLRVEKSDST